MKLLPSFWCRALLLLLEEFFTLIASIFREECRNGHAQRHTQTAETNQQTRSLASRDLECNCHNVSAA
jgi:hypothetical protein